jgi:carboxyl-terminal processing protease
MRAVAGVLALALTLLVGAAAARAEGPGGVGLVVVVKRGAIEVSRVVPGSPAAQAGLHRGTRIVAIDGHAVAGKKVTEVAAELRGEPGTSVELTLEAPTRAVTLQRALLP